MELEKSIFDEPWDSTIVYATFWQRIAATLIDVLFFIPYYILNVYNETKWKSIACLIIMTMLVMAYKCVLEYKYGATLGKMALRLLVVDKKYQKIGFKEAVLRDIINLILGITQLAITVMIYKLPGFEKANTIKKYSALVRPFGYSHYIFLLSVVIIIIEIIFLVSDDHNRALHDRIAGTFVIKR